MGQARPGSEDRRLHEKYSGYLKRYEKILDERSPYATRSAKHTMDGIRQAEKADLARLQADLKPVESRLRNAEARLSGLEKDHGALKERLRVLGAQAKGDLAPIKITETLSHRGVPERKAVLETGKPRGFMAFFRRSQDVSRLPADVARSRLAAAEADISVAKETVRSVEAEREAILARPRYEAPRFPIAQMPSREDLLKQLHESQPLQRRPLKDPLAMPVVSAPVTQGPVSILKKTPVDEPVRWATYTVRRAGPEGDLRAHHGDHLERPGNPLARALNAHPGESPEQAQAAWSRLFKPLPPLPDAV